MVASPVASPRVRPDQYLDLLAGIGERRKLLDAVYHLEYEDAIGQRKKLLAIGKAYDRLRGALRDMMHELGSEDADGKTIFDAVGKISGPLELLDERRMLPQRQQPATATGSLGRRTSVCSRRPREGREAAQKAAVAETQC